jgi:hypothetical protein
MVKIYIWILDGVGLIFYGEFLKRSIELDPFLLKFILSFQVSCSNGCLICVGHVYTSPRNISLLDES